MNQSVLNHPLLKGAGGAVRRGAMGATLIQPGAINVYAFVPCPIEVRLKQTFEAYIAEYNQSAAKPIHCPNVVDTGRSSIGEELMKAESEADLPDVIVANDLRLLFAEPFRSRFLHLYQGVTKPSYLDALPGDYRTVAIEKNIGFLAFGRWSLVRDLSVDPDMPNPTSWADLTDDAYRNRVVMPRCSEHISGISLMMALEETKGLDAVTAFSRNVSSTKHFSQIIMGMDTFDEQRAALAILPGPVVAQIPSKKRAGILELTDGPVLMPILLYVRKDRIDQCQGALDFFWGETFRTEVLNRGNFETPDRIDWTKPFLFPDWTRLAEEDYDKRILAVTEIFKKESAPFPG